MKQVASYLAALMIMAIVLPSCKKWLDVNQNPSVPDETVPTPDQRLPPILAQFADGYESAGTRAAYLTQQLGITFNATNTNYLLTRWSSNASSANWPWQSFYVNTASNFGPMIEKAEQMGAYHYIGATRVIKAWGFGYLADFYGMLPYDEFDNPAVLTPKFDDGEYIQGKILLLLDSAIQDFGKQQSAGAPALAKGDIYNKGDVNKWIKLAYGLKARFLNHTSKLSSYNGQAILDALAHAPQSDAESTILQYVDEGPSVSSLAQTSLQYQNTSTTARVTKLYYNYLTNSYTGAPGGANNVPDPRIDSLVPRLQNPDGSFMQSKVMDMQSELPKTGPLAYTFNAATNRFSNKDSVYVQLRPAPLYPAAGDRIQSTGTWYTRKASKGLLLTNAEMRFIEAEVKFRMGDKPGALIAYKAGIRSHMNLMTIPAAKIDAFLNSTSVVQNAAAITLSQIMIQKFIAMSYSVENWTDMRRNNFCADAGGNYNEAAGIYKGFNRPSHVFSESYPALTDWPRRFAIPSYEINYNIEQVLKANPNASSLTYIKEAIWWDKP